MPLAVAPDIWPFFELFLYVYIYTHTETHRHISVCVASETNDVCSFMWMSYFCETILWLSSECLWSTQICVKARRQNLILCQYVHVNNILFGLTCLQKHASRTRRRLPWWCGSCRLETDHWGRWPLAQLACGWRSATVWWGCACRYKDKKDKNRMKIHSCYIDSQNNSPQGTC